MLRKSVDRRWRSALAAVFLSLSLAACGGAYSEAIGRGDKFAEAGMWDKAAAEYEAAIKLEPTNPEGTIKLKEVQRRQAGELLARGKSLLQRGELEQALVVIQQAARFDPENVNAQKALTEVNAQVLAKAEELLAAHDARKAFELTTLILKGSPKDMRAKNVDGKVRDRLAEQSYTRAETFLKNGKTGNALMEFAACYSFRDNYRDAKLRIGEVKLLLQKELMFTVVLEKFADTTSAKDLATSLSPELLGQGFKENLPLQVVKEAPAGKDAPRGVRVSGKFDAYTYVHDKNKESRSCDYVCGSDTKPNPQYADVERGVADAERRLAQAEEEVARHQKEVDRYQKDVDDIQKDLTKEEAESDKARADLDRCRANQKPGDTNSSACSSEDSRAKSEQSQVESARNRLSSPQGNLSSARSRMQSSNDNKNRARQDKERDTERMRTTPRTIEIPRHCAHNYSVDVHTLKAQVVVQLTAENLQDKTRILENEPFEYKVAQRDEAFPAQSGRCSEVAGGDALKLPTEKEVKQELVKQAIGGVREKVMATYERYRQRFLADARREEAAGLTDEAVEAYVRYLLTGPKSVDPKDGKQIGEFLAKTRGFGKLDLLGGL